MLCRSQRMLLCAPGKNIHIASIISIFESKYTNHRIIMNCHANIYIYICIYIIYINIRYCSSYSSPLATPCPWRPERPSSSRASLEVEASLLEVPSAPWQGEQDHVASPWLYGSDVEIPMKIRDINPFIYIYIYIFHGNSHHIYI